MEFEEGEVLRALRVDVCDIGETPSISSREWDLYMSFLSREETDSILKYRFDEDRRRALVSVFLQKCTVRHFLGAKSDAVFSIQRTPEKKPFAKPSHGFDIGTWNYNLSHHGKYVGIASHPEYLVGCDIVDLRTRTRVVRDCAGYLKLFQKQLHDSERTLIMSKTSEQERYNTFFIIWSLKEAFVKAIGQGLDFDWQSICFKVSYSRGADDEEAVTEDEAAAGASGYGDFESEFIYGTAVAVIHGKESEDWRFRFQSIDISHIITVALGPLQASLPSYSYAAWKKVPDRSANKASAMAQELRAWAEGTAPLPLLHVSSFASLLSPEHQEVARCQLTELPVSPPFVDLNNRNEDTSVVFKSVQERIAAASNHGTPAVPEPEHQGELTMPFSPFSPDVYGDAYVEEDGETPEAPWRVPGSSGSSISSVGSSSAADHVWARASSYSASTISMSDVPTAAANETTETNVSFHSMLDINSPAAWRQQQPLPLSLPLPLPLSPRGAAPTAMAPRGVLGAAPKPPLCSEEEEKEEEVEDTPQKPIPQANVPFCICM